MVCFSYKSMHKCGIREHTHIEAFETRASLGYIDKWLWVISITMLFKTVIPLRTKE